MFNGSFDREIGTMIVSEIVCVVVDVVNMCYIVVEINFDVKELIIDVVYFKNGGIIVDVDAFVAMGVVVYECDFIFVLFFSGVKVVYYDICVFVNFFVFEFFVL